MKLVHIEILPGNEVMETLIKECKERNIENGSITSLIGAVDECCVSTMRKRDANDDALIEYTEPFEVSGSGEMKDGKPHIHIVLGREGNKTLSGHLHSAKVKTWFVSVYILTNDL